MSVFIFSIVTVFQLRLFYLNQDSLFHAMMTLVSAGLLCTHMLLENNE